MARAQDQAAQVDPMRLVCGNAVEQSRGMDLQLLLFMFVLVSASDSSSMGDGIPGPPIGLNWTMLNTSLTGTYVDIQVSWKPLPSAHIQNGWVNYQLQYKEVNESNWRKLDTKEATTVPLKNLVTCHDYELRVRAQQASGIYGEYSDMQYVSFDSADLVPCEKASSQRPYIINCRSPEMETFSCYWSNGNYPHLSTPETMQLLYVKSQGEWKECHDYVTAGKNSCYFNKTYTSIWTPYCIKLVSGNRNYDKDCFRVEDIVIPDPPIGLNWSVLNSSPTGIRMDIQVTWRPPPSADVQNGWVTLNYQLQYKGVNETKWKELDLKDVTTVPLYALKTCQDYEIRVRAKAVSEVYGEFSDVLYVSFGLKSLVPCEEEFHVHWPLMMVIGILGLMVMLSVVLFSKQQKLKILILPPVPVPKIKGIDPDLFKKGNLDEVNSILASHGSYMPQLHGEDSWVEFIELDIDEAEERTEGSDTDRLLGNDRLKSQGCLGVRDDDSGRASCCEPDIPETDFSTSDTCDGTSDIDQSKKANDKEDLFCLDQKDNEKPALGPNAIFNHPGEDKHSKVHVSVPNSTETNSSLIQTQLSNQNSMANIDFYTQVSDITPGGSVVLSPGQKLKMGKIQSEAPKESVSQCQAVSDVDNAYFCEPNVKKCDTVTAHKEVEPEVQDQSFAECSYVVSDNLTATAVNHGTVPVEEERESSAVPVADYTSVHVVQSPQGLMLNATALPVQEKEFNMSCGYVSTDQLHKILP